MKEPEQGEWDEKGRFIPSAPRRADGKGHTTCQEARQFFKVSHRKVDKAIKLSLSASELFEKVRQGTIKLNAAYREI